jgi:phosphorylcholine metabolism protein LicD
MLKIPDRPDRPDRIRRLEELLKYLAVVFDDAGLHYWLDFGSLLGMVRNGHLMAWDHDVEIGIFREDLSKLAALRKKIEKPGYKLFMDNRSPNVPCKKIKSHWKWPQIRLPGSSELDVEVMVYGTYPPSRDSKCVRLLGYPLHHKSLIAPRELFTNLDSVEFEGVNIAIPSQVESYLQLRYGPTWKVPNSRFYNNTKQVYSMRTEMLIDYLMV